MPEINPFPNRHQQVRLGANKAPAEELPLAKVGRGITVQIVLITPEIAKAWLEKAGHIQRRVRRGHVKMIAWDITNGRWKLTGETIIFDSDNKLSNGQHRLLSIVESNKAVESLVVRGVEPGAYFAMDACSPRTRGDALQSNGYANGNQLGCAAQLLQQYENGESLRAGPSSKLSTIGVTELMERHPGLADACSKGIAAGRICHSTGIPTFCYYIFTRIDLSDADTFFDTLISGEHIGKGNPIYALRARFLATKFNQYETIFLVFKAWNYFRAKKKCDALRIFANEPFPELT